MSVRTYYRRLPEVYSFREFFENLVTKYEFMRLIDNRREVTGT
ncbi:hypothetical protein [Dorea sp.]